MVEFSTSYSVNVPLAKRCQIMIDGEKIKFVKESNYLRTISIVLRRFGRTERIKNGEL